MADEFTIEDLRRILRAAAGADEGTHLTTDIHDAAFDELGYDSLALLETGSRIEREYGISLDDSTVIEARTPRVLLAAVNARLSIEKRLVK
ncbi:Oxytetracycline polyketide synthase acyl carrier protein [Micromonospora sp. MW-13]|uniref:SaqC n=1 Tax=Micromonospora sp. Tu 6368 TaxID=428986 RepID=C4NYK1_9ACTN|nr:MULTISPECIES: acyl carrier protein [unclassified Micromonospora]ACP19355.1 SaqC [Micromonospora sp. Tu 6368]MCX4469491.1 acyl carrier protein [Micromonospora sp. NBC_01655]RGC65140.1 Oxytetracycline polyketide synthase acyl carrier protein [Micromonospora sp. MW-13]